MPGGEVREATDDGPRAVDPGRPAAPDAGGDPGDPGRRDRVPASRGRVWLRRLGVGLVVLLAAVPIGLQVQAASERGEAERKETAQRQAERDEASARNQLATVNSRVVIARSEEDAAQGELDGSRADMAAKGLEEAALGDLQRQTARHVKDLRRQNRTVAKAIAEQVRMQPAAGDCLFDLLRSLGRVGSSHDGGAPSDACSTVADGSTGPG